MSIFVAIVGVGVVNHLHWIWMAALLAIWRVIQDYFTYPRIMGRHLSIHPLAAIFAVLLGAEVGGIVGIYLAVPLMASMRVMWRARAGAERNYQFHPVLTAEAPSSLAETAAD